MQPTTSSGCHARSERAGQVKLVLHRQTEGTLKSATFRQDATGKWYVTLVYHGALPAMPAPPVAPAVGIDLGLKDLAVTSDGQRTPAPRHYRAAERKLKRLQRHFFRCKKGSRNRQKARIAVARQHQRVANLRHDTLHQRSHELTRDYNTVCIEDLHVSSLAKTKLGKRVLDAAWATLRAQLVYKALWRGKRLIVVGRFFPSSRLCSVCGTINPDLTLSERVWTCGCGTVHDRDLNAARNIRAAGLRLLAGGTPDRQNASRVPVSLATGEHDTLTEEAHRLEPWVVHIPYYSIPGVRIGTRASSTYPGKAVTSSSSILSHLFIRTQPRINLLPSGLT